MLDYKLEVARKLLDSGHFNVNEVGLKVGYSTASHFITAFKKKYGVTPKNTFNQIKKMKALHITLFALLISLGSVAQTDKESIQKWADIYMVYVQNNDIDKILDAMLPQLFETISRSQIKASMEQMLNNSNMKVEYLSAKINSISNTVKRDDTKYALVNYDSSFKMIF